MRRHKSTTFSTGLPGLCLHSLQPNPVLVSLTAKEQLWKQKQQTQPTLPPAGRAKSETSAENCCEPTHPRIHTVADKITDGNRLISFTHTFFCCFIIVQAGFWNEKGMQKKGPPCFYFRLCFCLCRHRAIAAGDSGPHWLDAIRLAWGCARGAPKDMGRKVKGAKRSLAGRFYGRSPHSFHSFATATTGWSALVHFAPLRIASYAVFGSAGAPRAARAVGKACRGREFSLAQLASPSLASWFIKKGKNHK